MAWNQSCVRSIHDEEVAVEINEEMAHNETNGLETNKSDGSDLKKN